MIKKDFDDVAIKYLNNALHGLTNDYIKAYSIIHKPYSRPTVSSYLIKRLANKFKLVSGIYPNKEEKEYLTNQISKRFSQLHRAGFIKKSGHNTFSRIVTFSDIPGRLKYSSVKIAYDKPGTWTQKLSTSKNLLEDDSLKIKPDHIEKIVLTIDKSNDKVPNYKYVNLVEIAVLIKQAKDDYIKLARSLCDLAQKNNKHIDQKHIDEMLRELIK